MLGKKKYRVSVMDRSTRVARERDKWRGLVIGPNLQQGVRVKLNYYVKENSSKCISDFS